MVTSAREKKPRRNRNHYTFTLTFLVILVLFLLDPDSGLVQNLPFGSTAIATLIVSFRPIIVITLIHYTRKAIFDYVDLGTIYDQVMASDNQMAKALFAVAMALFTIGFAVVFAASMGN